MKDCDGNELAVGDVVEVVTVAKREPVKYDHGGAIVCSIEDDGQALLTGDAGWMGWYPIEQLRLVRRKEPTNG